MPPWRRIAVAGHSMEPTLRDGDWLVVDQGAYRRAAPRVGDLVVTRDPRVAERLLIKRVAFVDAEGYLALAGDHPAHRHVPEYVQPDQILVPPSTVLGRPFLRYWPPRRLGRVS